MGTVQNFLKIFNTRGRFAFVVFLFAILILPVSAQAVVSDSVAPPPSNTPTSDSEGVTLVATVDIQDLAILKQDKNALTISFTISNGEFIQPKIMYAVQLWSKDQLEMVGQKIYSDDVVSLRNNDSVKKVVTYVAPSYLKGSYLLRVQARNPEGFSLAIEQFSDAVTLAGTNENINISQCFLTVDGEKGEIKYTLPQGVDISAEETLVAHCSLMNTFSTEQTVTPIFQTHYRTSFGKLVGTVKSDPLTLKPNQKTAFTVKLPKPTEPQAYDSILTFTGKNNETLSSPATFHYVIRGESATIHTLKVDKNSYLAGETAKVTFSWSGSADNFSFSRLGHTESKGLSAKFAMTTSGNPCAEPFTKALERNESRTESFSVPVARDCQNPTVSMKISNESGKILAENSYDIKNPPKAAAVVSDEPVDNSVATMMVIIFIFVAGLGLYLWKKNKHTAVSMLFGLVVGMSVFAGGHEAHAGIYIFNDSRIDVGAANLSINTNIFNPGNTLRAIAIVQNGGCNNLNRIYTRATASANTPSGFITQNVNGVFANFTVAGPGSYNVIFNVEIQYDYFVGVGAPGANAGGYARTSKTFTTYVPYTVVAPPSNAKDITAFNFASPLTVGVIDQGARTITLTVPSGTNVGALTPSINVSPGASVLPISGGTNNFAGPVGYTVTAANGTQKSYVVTVTVAPSATKALTFIGITESGAYVSTATPGSGINEAAKTVTLNVPFGGSPNHLTVTAHTGTSINPATGAIHSDGTFLYTVTAADATTAVYTVTITTLACVVSSWSPDPSGTCSTSNVTQTSNCGTTRSVTGTKSCCTVSSWSPDPSGTCSTSNVTQTSNCGTTRSVTGTKSCSATKSITAFNFNSFSPAVTGTISGTAISLTVPFGTNVTALVPTITHTGASISPNTGVANNFLSPVNYTVTAADGTAQTYTATVTVAPNTTKDITSFNFTKSENPVLPATVIGTINQGTKTILLKVRYGTNITALVPTITHTGASISPVNLQARNFKNPVVYTVTDAMGGTQDYTVTVKKVNSFNFVEF